MAFLNTVNLLLSPQGAYLLCLRGQDLNRGEGLIERGGGVI